MPVWWRMGCAEKEARSGGFTLIEMAIVLSIVGLLMSMGLRATSGFMENDRRKQTIARLDMIEQALALYVAQNGRLPCPADANVGGTEAPVGGGVCSNAQIRGIVPWVTLNLPETAGLDGWGRRITYRVYDQTSLGLTVPPATPQPGGADMSWCDSAGTAVADATGTGNTQLCDWTVTAKDMTTYTSPTNFLANKGLRVADGAGTLLASPTAGTGAAYVLISHGRNGAGAFPNRITSTVLTGSGIAASALEQGNYNNVAVTAYSGAGATTSYRDSTYIDDVATNHFDDLIRWPTIMAVATRAGRGPRAHN
ncbi:MAG: type II secretion system GspH family protein [Rhodospirillales bacterium]|nr:type II secretion system GspH family protein [Rhodospirillales bacterium]